MSKVKPINLNLKQVDISNDKTKKNEFSKSMNDKESKSEKSSKSNSANQKDNQKDNQNKSKTDQSANSGKKQSNQLTSTSEQPATKKLKVPFEVKPAKPEPKYSPNNQNLRLLNQSDNSRQNLFNNKITKLDPNKQTDKERPLDRSNLKSISTTVNQIDNKNQNKTNPLNVKQHNHQINQKINHQSNQKIQKNAKQQNERGNISKLADFYLKIVPDLEEQDFFLTSNKSSDKNEKSSNSSNNQKTNKESANQATNKSDKSINDNSFASNLSKQFLSNEKKRLEVEQLIDVKIKNDYEKNQMKNTVDRLMKSLVNYKQSTYTPQLADELNTGLENLRNKVQDQDKDN